MKLVTCISFAIATQLVGCFESNPTRTDSVCTVTAPSVLNGEQSSAQEVAADLTAFAKLPLKVDFKNDIRSKFDFTFQKVSDANARCQMLTQLAACYKNEVDARDEILKLISSTNACSGS